MSNDNVLIVASNNKDKIVELKELLADLSIVSMSEAGINIDIVENGSTFEENAIIKARTVHDISHKATIADDSGICIDALDGKPGIYSARFAGENANDEDKNRIVLNKMKDVSYDNRTAYYECCIAYCDNKGCVKTFTGKCFGHIAFEPIGNGGFGYDPLFIPDEYPMKTMAQLLPTEKNTISHRGRALNDFFRWYNMVK